MNFTFCLVAVYCSANCHHTACQQNRFCVRSQLIYALHDVSCMVQQDWQKDQPRFAAGLPLPPLGAVIIFGAQCWHLNSMHSLLPREYNSQQYAFDKLLLEGTWGMMCFSSPAFRASMIFLWCLCIWFVSVSNGRPQPLRTAVHHVLPF